MPELTSVVVAARRRGLARELAEALRTGPFERALRLAIRSRGLTLERIRVRLLERGVRTSLASLSNWQRGRCRPERARSLQAVRELEDILGLPADSLVTLLGPRRPRGRWLQRAADSATEAVEAVRVRLIVETAAGVAVFDQELAAELMAGREG
ncbi:MAG: hypothetical protein L0Y54_19295 [Sporichthyaceae bacterium]|nr:hypothetical protein [Sporichthyaceae bacterium]